MKCKLAFNDWQRNGVSIYNTEEGIDLSSGDLHSGTIFNCNIQFDDPFVEKDLLKAAKDHTALAVFILLPGQKE